MPAARSFRAAIEQSPARISPRPATSNAGGLFAASTFPSHGACFCCALGDFGDRPQHCDRGFLPVTPSPRFNKAMPAYEVNFPSGSLAAGLQHPGHSADHQARRRRDRCPVFHSDMTDRANAVAIPVLEAAPGIPDLVDKLCSGLSAT